ncbi:hypothetical protein GWI33_013823 [Rhynchophorus ferrugineus]|uniref:Uncharacterized protein n=1 Tax=Rhynchophorus ferrugineus TaxID=354439 RepID=A0A834MCX4_RHYFE|nr:hypothetical protein GWI33_013823 [Rhynchophorus ferrugineus]
MNSRTKVKAIKIKDFSHNSLNKAQKIIIPTRARRRPEHYSNATHSNSAVHSKHHKSSPTHARIHRREPQPPLLVRQYKPQ